MESNVTCRNCGAEMELADLVQPYLETERKKLLQEDQKRTEKLRQSEAEIEERRAELGQREQQIHKTVRQQVEAERVSIAEAAAREAATASEAELRAARERVAEMASKLQAAQEVELAVRSERENIEAREHELELTIARRLDAERSTIREEVSKTISLEIQALQQQLAAKDAKVSEAQAAEQSLRLQRQLLEEEKRELTLQIERTLDSERQKIREEARKDIAGDLELLKQQLATREAKLAEAQEAEIALRTQRQQLEDDKRELALQVERTLDAERQKIREDAQRAEEERQHYKLKEKEEQIEAMNRTIADLRRKGEQGSQQLQGEALEGDLETTLRDLFPDDGIEPVSPGGDVLHKVMGLGGTVCGTILWEGKNTKSFNNAWLTKARDDQREARADVVAIMSVTLPDGIANFGLREGVWITNPACAASLAVALRHTLIQTARERRAAQGQKEKQAIVYSYLTGPEFRQNIVAIVSAHKELLEDLDAEKRALQKHWKRREKQLARVLDGTVGMVGDLGGIIGKAMPEIEGLALPSADVASLTEGDETHDDDADGADSQHATQ
jgi:hypothetical protein